MTAAAMTTAPMASDSTPRPSGRLLESLAGRAPPAPAWFHAALAQPPERTFVPVNGADIEALSWGRRGAPGLLLLHGQGANADWWSFIAPFFADRFRVTALSWSGMGRSSWREEYGFAIYADEIFTVAQACGLFESGAPPIMAGHSYGGIPLMFASKDRGHLMGGAIIIDCYFRPDNQPPIHKVPPMTRSMRPYETLEKALARFKLEPAQDCTNLFIVDYIARQSLKYVEAVDDQPAGWTWRFDPMLRLKSRKTAIAPYLKGMTCPLVMMSGARSNLLTPPVRKFMLGLAPAGTPWVTIPDSDHHVMLDQPLALAAALNAVLTFWPHRR
jgi:pimeloyl-ACP methyl ester carboxylesterase